MTKPKMTKKSDGTKTRQKNKKKLERLVDEAVKKVVAEYGDVLRRLGKE